MNKSEVIIDWSGEDQAFVAEVPELPGCAAHGTTYEAALASRPCEFFSAGEGFWFQMCAA
jgi:hypothetical protein